MRQNEIKKENEVGGDNDTDDDNERFSIRINESVRRCTANTEK